MAVGRTGREGWRSCPAFLAVAVSGEAEGAGAEDRGVGAGFGNGADAEPQGIAGLIEAVW